MANAEYDTERIFRLRISVAHESEHQGNADSPKMLADLIREGLATAHHETMRVGKRKIKVTRVRITDAGRRALTSAGHRSGDSLNCQPKAEGWRPTCSDTTPFGLGRQALATP